ncbi:MAG: hypothetical protein EP343_13795 [Deltaproteobacteria bacterium]|nr:MAG: hypothetical protein EP343_13795 [Deltaproteobacteria bacterium]
MVHRKALPDACFDLALCDLVEALLQREEEQGRQTFAGSRQALTCKRLWVAGQCSEEEMEEASDAAKRAYLRSKDMAGLGTSLMSQAEDAFARAVRRYVGTTSFGIQAAYTAYLASRFRVHRSTLSAGRNSFYLLLDRLTEPSWLPFLHLRMVHWVKESVRSRELLLDCLLLREAQLDAEAQRWRDEMEDPLFEE